MANKTDSVEALFSEIDPHGVCSERIKQFLRLCPPGRERFLSEGLVAWCKTRDQPSGALAHAIRDGYAMSRAQQNMPRPDEDEVARRQREDAWEKEMRNSAIMEAVASHEGMSLSLFIHREKEAQLAIQSEFGDPDSVEEYQRWYREFSRACEAKGMVRVGGRRYGYPQTSQLRLAVLRKKGRSSVE